MADVLTNFFTAIPNQVKDASRRVRNTFSPHARKLQKTAPKELELPLGEFSHENRKETHNSKPFGAAAPLSPVQIISRYEDPQNTYFPLNNPGQFKNFLEGVYQACTHGESVDAAVKDILLALAPQLRAGERDFSKYNTLIIDLFNALLSLQEGKVQINYLPPRSSGKKPMTFDVPALLNIFKSVLVFLHDKHISDDTRVPNNVSAKRFVKDIFKEQLWSLYTRAGQSDEGLLHRYGLEDRYAALLKALMKPPSNAPRTLLPSPGNASEPFRPVILPSLRPMNQVKPLGEVKKETQKTPPGKKPQSEEQKRLEDLERKRRQDETRRAEQEKQKLEKEKIEQEKRKIEQERLKAQTLQQTIQVCKTQLQQVIPQLWKQDVTPARQPHAGVLARVAYAIIWFDNISSANTALEPWTSLKTALSEVNPAQDRSIKPLETALTALGVPVKAENCARSLLTSLVLKDGPLIRALFSVSGNISWLKELSGSPQSQILFGRLIANLTVSPGHLADVLLSIYPQGIDDLIVTRITDPGVRKAILDGLLENGSKDVNCAINDQFRERLDRLIQYHRHQQNTRQYLDIADSKPASKTLKKFFISIGQDAALDLLQPTLHGLTRERFIALFFGNGSQPPLLTPKQAEKVIKMLLASNSAADVITRQQQFCATYISLGLAGVLNKWIPELNATDVVLPTPATAAPLVNRVSALRQSAPLSAQTMQQELLKGKLIPANGRIHQTLNREAVFTRFEQRMTEIIPEVDVNELARQVKPRLDAAKTDSLEKALNALKSVQDIAQLTLFRDVLKAAGILTESDAAGAQLNTLVNEKIKQVEEEKRRQKELEDTRRREETERKKQREAEAAKQKLESEFTTLTTECIRKLTQVATELYKDNATAASDSPALSLAVRLDSFIAQKKVFINRETWSPQWTALSQRLKQWETNGKDRTALPGELTPCLNAFDLADARQCAAGLITTTLATSTAQANAWATLSGLTEIPQRLIEVAGKQPEHHRNLINNLSKVKNLWPNLLTTVDSGNKLTDLVMEMSRNDIRTLMLDTLAPNASATVTLSDTNAVVLKLRELLNAHRINALRDAFRNFLDGNDGGRKTNIPDSNTILARLKSLGLADAYVIVSDPKLRKALLPSSVSSGPLTGFITTAPKLKPAELRELETFLASEGPADPGLKQEFWAAYLPVCFAERMARWIKEWLPKHTLTEKDIKLIKRDDAGLRDLLAWTATLNETPSACRPGDVYARLLTFNKWMDFGTLPKIVQERENELNREAQEKERNLKAKNEEAQREEEKKRELEEKKRKTQEEEDRRQIEEEKKKEEAQRIEQELEKERLRLEKEQREQEAAELKKKEEEDKLREQERIRREAEQREKEEKLKEELRRKEEQEAQESLKKEREKQREAEELAQKELEQKKQQENRLRREEETRRAAEKAKHILETQRTTLPDLIKTILELPPLYISQAMAHLVPEVQSALLSETRTSSTPLMSTLLPSQKTAVLEGMNQLAGKVQPQFMVTLPPLEAWDLSLLKLALALASIPEDQRTQGQAGFLAAVIPRLPEFVIHRCKQLEAYVTASTLTPTEQLAIKQHYHIWAKEYEVLTALVNRKVFAGDQLETFGRYLDELKKKQSVDLMPAVSLIDRLNSVPVTEQKSPEKRNPLTRLQEEKKKQEKSPQDKVQKVSPGRIAKPKALPVTSTTQEVKSTEPEYDEAQRSGEFALKQTPVNLFIKDIQTAVLSGGKQLLDKLTSEFGIHYSAIEKQLTKHQVGHLGNIKITGLTERVFTSLEPAIQDVILNTLVKPDLIGYARIYAKHHGGNSHKEAEKFFGVLKRFTNISRELFNELEKKRTTRLSQQAMANADKSTEEQEKEHDPFKAELKARVNQEATSFKTYQSIVESIFTASTYSTVFSLLNKQTHPFFHAWKDALMTVLGMKDEKEAMGIETESARLWQALALIPEEKFGTEEENRIFLQLLRLQKTDEEKVLQDILSAKQWYETGQQHIEQTYYLIQNTWEALWEGLAGTEEYKSLLEKELYKPVQKPLQDYWQTAVTIQTGLTRRKEGGLEKEARKFLGEAQDALKVILERYITFLDQLSFTDTQSPVRETLEDRLNTRIILPVLQLFKRFSTSTIIGGKSVNKASEAISTDAPAKFIDSLYQEVMPKKKEGVKQSKETSKEDSVKKGTHVSPERIRGHYIKAVLDLVASGTNSTGFSLRKTTANTPASPKKEEEELAKKVKAFLEAIEKNNDAYNKLDKEISSKMAEIEELNNRLAEAVQKKQTDQVTRLEKEKAEACRKRDKELIPQRSNLRREVLQGIVRYEKYRFIDWIYQHCREENSLDKTRLQTILSNITFADIGALAKQTLSSSVSSGGLLLFSPQAWTVSPGVLNGSPTDLKPLYDTVALLEDVVRQTVKRLASRNFRQNIAFVVPDESALAEWGRAAEKPWGPLALPELKPTPVRPDKTRANTGPANPLEETSSARIYQQKEDTGTQLEATWKSVTDPRCTPDNVERLFSFLKTADLKNYQQIDSFTPPANDPGKKVFYIRASLVYVMTRETMAHYFQTPDAFPRWYKEMVLNTFLMQQKFKGQGNMLELLCRDANRFNGAYKPLANQDSVLKTFRVAITANPDQCRILIIRAFSALVPILDKYPEELGLTKISSGLGTSPKEKGSRAVQKEESGETETKLKKTVSFHNSTEGAPPVLNSGKTTENPGEFKPLSSLTRKRSTPTKRLPSNHRRLNSKTFVEPDLPKTDFFT